MATINSRKKNKILFYCLLLAFPILQFCIFYIWVNFNGIMLSFKVYDNGVYKPAGFSNFVKFFNAVKTEGVFKVAIVNSLKVMGIDLIIIMPLTLFFSYYIAKGFSMYKFYRVVLFLPSIVSPMVMVLVYRYFLEDAVFQIIKNLTGKTVESFLFGGESRRFFWIVFYYIFMSFGTGTLLYSGAMSGISKDLIEAANLDGASGIKEFWYISVPGVWPTLVVLTLAKLTGFFTNKLNLFSFYGTAALNQNYTIGYYLFKNTYGDLATMSVFPYLSAMGVVFTLIIAPITILLKYIMEKLGPSED